MRILFDPISSRFVLNGLAHANRILGKEAFVLSEWRVIGEYVHDSNGGRHQAFYSPIRDTFVLGERIPAHERIQVEQSLKYSAAEATALWRSAGMSETRKWQHTNKEHGKPTSLLGIVFISSQTVSAIPLLYLCRTAPETLRITASFTDTRNALAHTLLHAAFLRFPHAIAFRLYTVPVLLARVT